MVAEAQILQEETILPVYVVPEDEQLLCMYEEVNQAVASKSASVLVRGESLHIQTKKIKKLNAVATQFEYEI